MHTGTHEKKSFIFLLTENNNLKETKKKYKYIQLNGQSIIGVNIGIHFPTVSPYTPEPDTLQILSQKGHI